ncbi:hypothetical protein ACH4SP_42255 [Streptomyces sp. NPDC021093]|uniref:hypothetical protein n=1 Tax=Streptomyces sp. NPDC021093 TaxID=3365112 RepID=UPI0037B8B952
MSAWHVVRVPDPGRLGASSAEGVLGVQGLPEAVARIGLRPGDPVFVRPDGMVDVDLLDFVRSKEFRNLERKPKRNYATDTRQFYERIRKETKGIPESEIRLRKTVTQLKKTIANQRAEIEELRQLIRNLTLASAVLIQTNTPQEPSAPTSGNVVQLRPPTT